MSAKYLLGNILLKVWFFVFLGTSLFGILFQKREMYQMIDGLPLYVSYYTVINTLVILVMFGVLHYLVFTNQADFHDFSIFYSVFLIWAMLMIFLAIDPAWWITRIIGLGTIFLGIEDYIPNWPHRLKEWGKNRFYIDWD